jgi:hypothetical protein
MSLTPPHAGTPEGHLATIVVEGRLHTGASTSLTPPHAGAPEGHLAVVEVTLEEAVEVAGEGGLGGGEGCLGGGGTMEHVMADREAQGGAAEHGRRG